ncbi:hypothetical protein ALQ94_200081 [Pseudomonas amygdali pv. morsprunorum]|uniref:Uncharacterized protein n=1 Tax=Pseudomonas amygdali pv. morsprunorum TaxID=129138 RepID=A0A3M2WHL6_PSEA0|nr:hypothetical protein ALQ94_200081 [Pseudomonas amygdali pv. morsprunorum]
MTTRHTSHKSKGLPKYNGYAPKSRSTVTVSHGLWDTDSRDRWANTMKGESTMNPPFPSCNEISQNCDQRGRDANLKCSWSRLL